MVVIPGAHRFTIAILIELGALVVIVAVLVVAFAMTVPLPLRERDAPAGENYRQCGAQSPFSYIHGNSKLLKLESQPRPEPKAMQSETDEVCLICAGEDESDSLFASMQRGYS